MIKRWIVLAGEEGGPACNKMGGIWNVIDAESKMLAELVSRGEIDCDLRILVAGPYFQTHGADWNGARSRVTRVDEKDGFEPLNMGSEISATIDLLKKEGIEVVAAQKEHKGVPIGYLLFNTNYYDTIIARRYGQDMNLTNAIKKEAWDLVRLDSMHFERAPYGPEYTHYTNLSYAISQFVRNLVTLGEMKAEKYKDGAISEFAMSVMPKMQVSLHCHEFGVFYALARLKSLGLPVRTMATLHATIPGRSSGYRSLEKIARNDSVWEPNVPTGMATLESLAKYADVTTFVGDSTKKEAMLFYGLDGIVVRNGIDVTDNGIDWVKKNRCRKKIQKFLSDKLHNQFGGERIDPENILPIFTISRIEIENKGYPQLLDSLLLQDHLIKHRKLEQRFAGEIRVVCLLMAAHGPKSKDKLPEGFPVDLPLEVLVGEEIRLSNMIQDRALDAEKLVSGKRQAAALLYPQWVGPDDGGFNMSAEDIMSGCVAGIFPSQYEPFLLTGLEAGREGTPSIVSRACGFSDALRKVERLVTGLGGVVVVDNIASTHQEMTLDYALAMDYFTWTYLDDQVKYRLLCEESFSLAKLMDWTKPVLEYYRNLVVETKLEKSVPEENKSESADFFDEGEPR